MAKTFSLCRQEIIYEPAAIRGFMERWPAIFNVIIRFFTFEILGRDIECLVANLLHI